MKIKLVTIAAIVFFATGLSLHAANPCPAGGMTCISIATGQNAITGTTFAVNNEDISPYTGILNQTVGTATSTSSVSLHCDDLNNGVQSGFWNVNVSAVTGNLANTKFITSNPHAAMPTGTSLYEEAAWLYTQMQVTGNQTAATLSDIQEAAWNLTSAGAVVSGNVTAWDNAAAADYNNTSVNALAIGATTYTVHSAIYADWFVFTDAASAGNSDSSGNQEFLGYFSSGAPALTGMSAAPEPATFWLLGSALLLGGAFARRKSLKSV